MVGWDVAKKVLSIHPANAGRSRYTRTAWRTEITNHLSRITNARARAQLLRFRLLGHLFGGDFGDFHERQLQAADYFNQQIVVFLR